MRDLRAALAILIICLCLPAFGQTYDVVIRGGRVLDPETGLDAVRDVGISGDKIIRISEAPLSGRRTIEARGLVVAPGFIDLINTAKIQGASGLKHSTA